MQLEPSSPDIINTRGMQVKSSAWLPRTMMHAVDDGEDRLHAMTLHHVVLDLVPLHVEGMAVFYANGCVYVHPDNLPLIIGAINRGEMPDRVVTL